MCWDQLLPVQVSVKKNLLNLLIVASLKEVFYFATWKNSNAKFHAVCVPTLKHCRRQYRIQSKLRQGASQSSISLLCYVCSKGTSGTCCIVFGFELWNLKNVSTDFTFESFQCQHLLLHCSPTCFNGRFPPPLFHDTHPIFLSFLQHSIFKNNAHDNLDLRTS